MTALTGYSCLMFPTVALGFIPLLAHAVPAQECTRVPLPEVGSLHGRTISALTVTTSPPDRMPGAAGALEALHVRTTAATIRRQFLLQQETRSTPCASSSRSTG